MKWEYTSLGLTANSTDDDMTEMGKKGWEAYAIIKGFKEVPFVVFFKRPIPQQVHWVGEGQAKA